MNLGPLHFEHRVLATGPPGKSPKSIFLNKSFPLLLHGSSIQTVNPLCFLAFRVCCSQEQMKPPWRAGGWGSGCLAPGTAHWQGPEPMPRVTHFLTLAVLVPNTHRPCWFSGLGREAVNPNSVPVAQRDRGSAWIGHSRSAASC